ncbi:unnamed protein product [Durusdinium trenchii]|uniref:Uncharacterized protein n=1 Tax=Durusdinium trenchii TaxID=1381693 RepID=A0ABP0SZS7_9DINO
MGPEDGRGRLLKAPDAPVGDEVFIENVGMAGCLEAPRPFWQQGDEMASHAQLASDTIEKELASPRYPEVTAAGCAIPYGLTEQGCATIEMEAPEATGLFPQSTEEFAEVSATRSERSELQGVAEAGVPKPMREPKKKAKKARKRETKVEANAKATEAVEAEFGQAEIKVEVAEPIKAKEGCIYRIENAGALVQAERKSIARGALDVIPKGSTLTGELVPGIFEEGDRVEIKDDSKTFKKVTFGKICGKLLEATIVRKYVKEEDPRLVVRLTFTFGTLHGTFDQSELEPERWLQLHDGRFVPVGGLCGLESYEVVAEEVQYTSSCEPSDFIANCDPARKGDILAGNLILGSNEVEWVQVDHEKFLPLKANFKLLLKPREETNLWVVASETRLHSTKSQTGGRADQGLYNGDHVKGNPVWGQHRGMQKRVEFLELVEPHSPSADADLRPPKYLLMSDLKKRKKDSKGWRVNCSFAEFYRKLDSGEMLDANLLYEGEEVEGWLQKDGQWVMISSGVHEGLYIPRGNLRGEDTGSVLARYRFAEDMPKDSAYAAALVMWCVYRSSGWSTQCRSYFWSAVVMYTVSIILQGCLLALLVYVPLLSSEGGDPAACMYGIGAADSLFFPTGYGLTAHVGRGYEGFNVTTENRETDFARYELQVATHGALKSIIGLIAGMTGNESFHETAVNSISSLDPAADGKVFGIETHLFRFLGIFIFVVQWSRDFWTSVIHFYLLPPSGKGLGSASWIHTTREEVSLRFAGYHRADAKVFIVLGVFSMAISVYTVWL